MPSKNLEATDIALNLELGIFLRIGAAIFLALLVRKSAPRSGTDLILPNAEALLIKPLDLVSTPKPLIGAAAKPGANPAR